MDKLEKIGQFVKEFGLLLAIILAVVIGWMLSATLINILLWIFVFIVKTILFLVPTIGIFVIIGIMVSYCYLYWEDEIKELTQDA